MNAFDLGAQKVQRRGALALDKTLSRGDGDGRIFVVEALEIAKLFEAGFFRRCEHRRRQGASRDCAGLHRRQQFGNPADLHNRDIFDRIEAELSKISAND